MSKSSTYDLSYTQNRELSWLEFNKRVLDEAMDKTVPLLERLKFLSIFSTNLDEFFMIRVGSLADLSIMTPEERDNKCGLKPAEQLKAIFEKVAPFIKYRDEVYAEISNDLKPYGIEDIPYENLDKHAKKYVDQYYKNFLEPILSPQIIDPGHPFPHLKNKALYVAAILKKGQKEVLGIIDVPISTDPIIMLPKKSGNYIRTEILIAAHSKLFFTEYKIQEQAIISVTRNADISFDEEKFDEDSPDYMSKMAKLLKKRDRLAPVRLEIQGPSEQIDEILRLRLQISKKQIYHSICPLCTEYMTSLSGFDEKLYYKKTEPSTPAIFENKEKISDLIYKKDILLFYPFHSMKPFLLLLKEAANDPTVLSIKITIYRISANSSVAKYLCEAADNRKDVTVIMELRARFDEQNNIEWAKRLEESGCRVIYGTEKFKCHSKLCLITYKKRGKLTYITQIGTGNYHEKTAKLYTDLSLLTTDSTIAMDAIKFFQNMLTGNLNGNYSKLLVAPRFMKNEILSMIDREARKGKDGEIFIKANSITEREIIDHLARASQKGVNIRMIIRGICCILPQIPDKTENIFITSIVGKYLEHSRIYSFGKGEQQDLYISSADIMTRNQTRRVEIACPVLDSDLRKMLNDYINLLLTDNTKARRMNCDGTYEKKDKNKLFVNSQELLENNPPSLPSIHEKKNKVPFWKRFFHIE